MSGSCCGGSAKSEPAKVVLTGAPQAANAEQPTAKSDKGECCNDKSAKSEKQSCGC